MEGFWSLTFFTVFSQAAVGMAIIKALCGDQSERVLPMWLLVALAFTGIATAASLLHLSAPLSAPYSILNVESSWLSREILGVGLFGASLCAYFFIRTTWMRYLAAGCGVLLLYLMARLYTLPTVPAWNTCLTFASFCTAALLLGSTLALLLSVPCKGSELSAVVRGRQVACVGIALGAHLFVISWQSASFNLEPNICIFIGQYVLLLLGALLGFFAVLKAAAMDNVDTPSCPCTVISLLVLATLCIWGGVFVSRMLFYMSFTYFGM